MKFFDSILGMLALSLINDNRMAWLVLTPAERRQELGEWLVAKLEKKVPKLKDVIEQGLSTGEYRP